jgi:hypothetical protein
METEPSWALLAVVVTIVLLLTAVVARLCVTEARAVRPAPARQRRRGSTPGVGAGS